MSDEVYAKKPMTVKQAGVMRVMRAGGTMTEQYKKPGRYRLLDVKRNPLYIIQQRTFKALKDSERIIKKDSEWIANPIKRSKNVTHRKLGKDLPHQGIC